MSVGGSLGVEVGLLPGVGEVSPFLIVGIEGPVLAPEIHALELGLGLALRVGVFRLAARGLATNQTPS